MLTYKVILVAMSTVSGGLLRKPHYPYPLVYVRGGRGQHLVGGPEGKEDRPYEKKDRFKVRQYSLGL